ncbi:MAG: hypothetical protein HY553_07020, partial [Elusimicrobia bacterium]|nr:hypothetical protein [Elusimicrobiota bacterium]
PGGASVFIEASSLTISGAGSIVADGGDAAAAADSVTSAGSHPGGGGGGSGGGILLRVTGRLEASGTGRLSAKGGNGSTAASLNGSVNPGSGGGGGRIKVFANSASYNIAVTTGIGFVGGKFALTTYESTGAANNGSTGTASFGVIASSPLAPSIAAVHLTSVTYTWSIAISTWGDAPAGSRRFHVFASSSIAPLPAPQAQVGAAANTATELSMKPNTAYTRVITAYTDWGESLASNAVSTVTFASPPGPSTGTAFSSVQERQLTFHWGHGSGAEANPEDTEYEVWRSTRSDFGTASDSRLVALSTTPLNLTPETVYFFRVRAANRAGTLTAFSSTFSIATSTTPPTRPGAPTPSSPFSYDGAGTLSWAPATAPSGIKEYLLQVGSFPGGADIVNQAVGNVTTFALAGLASGRSYFGRVRARSNAELDGDFSDAGPALTVFVPAQEPAIAKPRNWPNPFDPATGPTTIGFSLPEPGTVVMKIFSLSGKLVYQEERHFGTTGNQVWPWDGTSSSGRRVSPGGYVIQLEKRMPSGVDVQRSKLAVLY